MATPANPKSPRKSSPKVYTDPDLRDRLKADITSGDKGGRPGQWSARKAQLLRAAYEKAGGGYHGPKTAAQKSLSEWTREDWQTADGEPAERGDQTARYLPKAAWDRLSPAEKKATDATKRAGSEKGKQFVPNTPAAAAARRAAAEAGAPA